jgi:hypothetical protein
MPLSDDDKRAILQKIEDIENDTHKLEGTHRKLVESHHQLHLKLCEIREVLKGANFSGGGGGKGGD